VVCTKDYYSATKKSEILLYAKWKNPGTEWKVSYSLTYEEFENFDFIEIVSRIVTRGWGECGVERERWEKNWSIDAKNS
jgi:hypothetical protein